MGENNIDVSDLLRRIENLEATIADLRANDSGEEEKPNKTSSDIQLDESETEEVYPFKVSVDPEDDVLKIYLPQGSCYYGGQEVEFPEGVSNNILAIPQCENNVWGVIKEHKEDGSTSASYTLSFEDTRQATTSTTNDDGSSDKVVVNFPVAKLGNNTNGVQIVHSAVSFGGGGSSGETIVLNLYKEFGYDYEEHKFWGKPIKVIIRDGAISKVEGYERAEETKEVIFRAVEETVL